MTTTAGAGAARPWHSGEPRRSRPHPEAVGGFQGRQQPAFAQPLMAGLESVVVPDHLYQHRIEGVAVSPSSSWRPPMPLEERRELSSGNFRVR